VFAAGKEPVAVIGRTGAFDPVADERFSAMKAVDKSVCKSHRRLTGILGTATRPNARSRRQRIAGLTDINTTTASPIHDGYNYGRILPCGRA